MLRFIPRMFIAFEILMADPDNKQSSTIKDYIKKQIAKLGDDGYGGAKKIVSLLSYPHLHTFTRQSLISELNNALYNLPESKGILVIEKLAKNGSLRNNEAEEFESKYAQKYKKEVNAEHQKKHFEDHNKLIEINFIDTTIFGSVKKNVIIQIGLVNNASNARFQLGLVNKLVGRAEKAGFRIGISNKADGDMKGANIALWGNYCKYGKMKGLNLAIISNSAEDITGVNIACFANMAGPRTPHILGHLGGFSLALYNEALEKTTGITIGALNYGHYLENFTVGLINIGGKSNCSNGGLQDFTFGIINSSNESYQYVTIGVLNRIDKKVKLPIYIRFR